MTTDKDRKRLIRARMDKTGESYTAARTVVLAKGRKQEARPPMQHAAPRAQWPQLAGTSDTALRDKTGRDWAGWVAALDAVEAFKRSHRDIARHIADAHPEIGGWWAQTVTVGYERIHGLREVGQRRDGAYEASKSRTYPVDISLLFHMFKNDRTRRRFLGDDAIRLRTAIDNKSIRFDWQDGTQVHLYFTDKGAGKSAVAVQHVKLTAKADIDSAKAYWSERLDALGAALRESARQME